MMAIKAALLAITKMSQKRLVRIGSPCQIVATDVLHEIVRQAWEMGESSLTFIQKRPRLHSKTRQN